MVLCLVRGNRIRIGQLLARGRLLAGPSRQGSLNHVVRWCGILWAEHSSAISCALVKASIVMGCGRADMHRRWCIRLRRFLVALRIIGREGAVAGERRATSVRVVASGGLRVIRQLSKFRFDFKPVALDHIVVVRLFTQR